MLDPQMIDMLIEGTWESIYMTVAITVISYLIGIPLGVFLVLSDRGGIHPMPGLNWLVGGIVNILLSDERGEISAANRDFSLDVGACTDVIRFSGKKDALTAAVRAMRPDLIITDEVVSASEIEALAACVRGGVAVVASAHCKDAAALLASPVFARAAEEKLFDYYVQLSARGVGRGEQIFDAALAPVGTC